MALTLLMGTKLYADLFGKWSGFVYSNGSDLKVYISAGNDFETLKDCRKACKAMISKKNW